MSLRLEAEFADTDGKRYTTTVTAPDKKKAVIAARVAVKTEYGVAGTLTYKGGTSTKGA